VTRTENERPRRSGGRISVSGINGVSEKINTGGWASLRPSGRVYRGQSLSSTPTWTDHVEINFKTPVQRPERHQNRWRSDCRTKLLGLHDCNGRDCGCRGCSKAEGRRTTMRGRRSKSEPSHYWSAQARSSWCNGECGNLSRALPCFSSTLPWLPLPLTGPIEASVTASGGGQVRRALVRKRNGERHSWDPQPPIAEPCSWPCPWILPLTLRPWPCRAHVMEPMRDTASSSSWWSKGGAESSLEAVSAPAGVVARALAERGWVISRARMVSVNGVCCRHGGQRRAQPSRARQWEVTERQDNIAGAQIASRTWAAAPPHRRARRTHWQIISGALEAKTWPNVLPCGLSILARSGANLSLVSGMISRWNPRPAGSAACVRKGMHSRRETGWSEVSAPMTARRGRRARLRMSEVGSAASTSDSRSGTIQFRTSNGNSQLVDYLHVIRPTNGLPVTDRPRTIPQGPCGNDGIAVGAESRTNTCTYFSERHASNLQ